MAPSTRLEPRAKSRNFLTARLRSWTEAVGLRLPRELTHKIRLCRANRCMMCFLLSGSPSQSLLKQMMSCPSIIRRRDEQNTYQKKWNRRSTAYASIKIGKANGLAHEIKRDVWNQNASRVSGYSY